MLEIKNLKFSYKKNIIFENINFNVKPGELVAILGLNGSGKTTLLKSIARIITPEKGQVFINNNDIEKLSRIDLAKNIGYLPQKYSGEFVTVFDTILLGRKIYINFSPSSKDIKVVNEIINKLNLNSIIFRNTNKLSGGELQKVLIARALAQEPKVLLLDEPINHLDIYNQIEVMNIIKNIVKEMKIIALIVIHDINIALRFFDKFLFLKSKKIYSYGDKNILTSKTLKDVYNIEAYIGELNGIKVVIPYSN